MLNHLIWIGRVLFAKATMNRKSSALLKEPCRDGLLTRAAIQAPIGAPDGFGKNETEPLHHSPIQLSSSPHSSLADISLNVLRNAPNPDESWRK